MHKISKNVFLPKIENYENEKPPKKKLPLYILIAISILTISLCVFYLINQKNLDESQVDFSTSIESNILVIKERIEWDSGPDPMEISGYEEKIHFLKAEIGNSLDSFSIISVTENSIGLSVPNSLYLIDSSKVLSFKGEIEIVKNSTEIKFSDGGLSQWKEYYIKLVPLSSLSCEELELLFYEEYDKLDRECNKNRECRESTIDAAFSFFPSALTREPVCGLCIKDNEANSEIEVWIKEIGNNIYSSKCTEDVSCARRDIDGLPPFIYQLIPTCSCEEGRCF